MINPRLLAILIASVVLLLSLSYAARTYLAHQHCHSIGRTYVPGQGCILAPATRPIILQRELHRS